MKVLLTSSNLLAQFPASFPNGTAALSAYLRAKGHDVKMAHLSVKRDLKRLPKIIESFEPQVVGMSALTCEAPLLPEIAAMVKRWNPRVPVLGGGIHVIVDPLSVLNLPQVDAVCCGEGEIAFEEYLGKFGEGRDVTDTRGFWFKRNGEILRNPPGEFIKDLDTLPYPDRTQVDSQKIINANNYVLNLIMGRGCKWSCAFCCNRYIRKANTGRYVRNPSVARALDEIVMLAEKYSFRFITLRDDNFPWDKEWALEFCQEYPRRLDMPFEVFARSDSLDEEIMDALKTAGCYSVFLGLDSGNDYIRNDVLHKRQDNRKLLQVAGYLKSVDIHPIISNIVGLPYETEQMHQDTIAINKEIYRDRVVFSPGFGAVPKIWVFDPWPGTELSKLCYREGWVREEAANHRHKVYRESCLDMPQFPRRDVHRCFRRFRYEVYRENFPLHAWLFRLYDTRLVEEIMEHIPLRLVGRVRDIVLLLFNKTVRNFFPKRKPGSARAPLSYS